MFPFLARFNIRITYNMHIVTKLLFYNVFEIFNWTKKIAAYSIGGFKKPILKDAVWLYGKSRTKMAFN